MSDVTRTQIVPPIALALSRKSVVELTWIDVTEDRISVEFEWVHRGRISNLKAKQAVRIFMSKALDHALRQTLESAPSPTPSSAT